MRDLDHQLRDYIDAVAPAVDIDEVKAGAPRVAEPVPITDRGRRRRWLPVAAVAAAVAVLAGVVLLVERRSDTAQVEVGSDGVTAWDWLAPLGSEVDAPTVPKGWKVLDFAELRFAVPPEWTVPVSESSAGADGESPGVVLIPNVDGSTCTRGSGPPDLPESVLRIETADPSLDGGVSDQIGTFSATRFDPSSCDDCPSVYRLDNGYQISVNGPDARQVRATFTDSGAHRDLQAGVVVDPSGWRSLDYAGIGLDIPADWGVVDLAASTEAITNPDGTVQWSSAPHPMMTDGSLFRPDLPYRTYLGDANIYQGGPAPLSYNLEPTEGVWVRSITDADAESIVGGSYFGPGPTPAVVQGEVDGLAVSVVRNARRSPAIDLVIRNGASATWVTLGVGLESSIARSILRSLHNLNARPRPRTPLPCRRRPTRQAPRSPSSIRRHRRARR